MRTWVMVLVSAALAGSCFADTIEMKETGLKLEGKILRETDDFVIILVHKEQGQIRVPRSKIKNIEYDIKTQLEKIAEDDFAGKYKVGLWAMEKGMMAEAVEVLESLEGKEGVPPERLKVLGIAYEKREQLDKALEKYSDYLKAHPDDKEVADRVQALLKLVNPNGQQGPGTDTKPKVVDGLEGDGAWVGENWGNPAKAAITTDPATGNKTVAISADAGDKDKTAITRTGQPLNLSESKEMVFKVFFNSQSPASIGVAFINSNNEFFECRPTRMATNSWTTVSIKVDASDFKTAPDWKHEKPIAGKERISRIVFLVYGQRQFTMHIDSVFFK